MAYADAPFGFVPIRHRNGAPYNGAARPYWVDSSDTTALFIGDPVVMDGTSNTSEIKVAGVGVCPPGTLPGCTIATASATNLVTGVVVGVAATTHESLPYRAASTERVVWVADDPDLVFMVQADGAVATTSIGLNTNIILAHAGSTATGRSGAEIDATAAADATYQCLILSAVNDPENEVNAAGNRFEVTFTLHSQIPVGGVLGL